VEFQGLRREEGEAEEFSMEFVITLREKPE
jgi:hypothetical protein